MRGKVAMSEQKKADPCEYDLDKEKYRFSERWEAMRKALKMPEKRGKDNGSARNRNGNSCQR